MQYVSNLDVSLLVAV